MLFHREGVLDFAPDHQPHQLFHVGVAGSQRFDVGAVAQHGDAIADGENLVQVVRDKHHADAQQPQIVHHAEQVLGLARRQRGGRLIQHQHPRLQRQRLGDLNELLLRHAQLLHRAIEIDSHRQPLENGLGLAPHRPPIQQAPAVPDLPVEEDVVDGAHVGNQREFLKNNADAGLDRLAIVVKAALLAVDKNIALVRLINAAHDFHQRRFAGAVFAQQGVHFAALNGQIDAVQRLHAGKALFIRFSSSKGVTALPSAPNAPPQRANLAAVTS